MLFAAQDSDSISGVSVDYGELVWDIPDNVIPDEYKPKPLTSKKAEELVRKYLIIEHRDDVFVNHDHTDEDGQYVIRVYENVIDNPTTGEGTQQTWGWYFVEPIYGTITNMI